MAKYRAQLLEPDKKGPKGEGFEVMKSGGKSIRFTHCFLIWRTGGPQSQAETQQAY